VKIIFAINQEKFAKVPLVVAQLETLKVQPIVAQIKK
jgi:hypothetical protein